MSAPLCGPGWHVDRHRLAARIAAATGARFAGVAALAALWLLRGKAALKKEVAQRTAIDVQTLPYRPEVIELVRSARAAGRRTVLATASDGQAGARGGSHLGLFDAVLASDGEHNLRGAGKRAAIEADAGGRGFSYAGNRPCGPRGLARAPRPRWWSAAPRRWRAAWPG